MSKPAASFIIPAYNAEKYIKECLNSIKHQTFQNWKCIIVNDGSTDNTLSIIEKFAESDTRFSYLTIPNSGAGDVPREKGISLAQSDWIVYVDADDYLDYDFLEKLMVRQKETNADIVYVRMQFFNDGKNSVSTKEIPAQDFNMSQIISGKDALLLTLPEWKIGANGAAVATALWNLRSKLVRNEETAKVCLDEYNTRELLILANTVAFADTNYHYRQHANSNTAKLTLKPFYNSIVRDKMIEELMAKYFEANSLQIKAVKQRRINNIINRSFLFYKVRKRLSVADRNIVKSMIKRYWVNLDKKNLFANNFVKRVLFTKNFVVFNNVIYYRYLLSSIKSLILRRK
jgi:glycosyltransferase involved in cell wall biosynthesis